MRGLMEVRTAVILKVQREVDTLSLFNLKFQFPNPNAPVNSNFK
jgi:hypothetical protein